MLLSFLKLNRAGLTMLLMCQIIMVSAQYLITGNLGYQYEAEMAHLDILNEWDEFATVSDEMTVKSVIIDENGNFKFEGNELSDKKGFYRIRYTNTLEPVTITWNPKNYINFIFSNTDTIEIVNHTFSPNNDANEELLKHMAKEDAFLQAIRHPENELHENLLHSKYKAYCKNEILNSQNGLSNLFCLATSEAQIKDDLTLYKKVYKELNIKTIRPTYYQSLEKVLTLNEYEYTSKNRKTWWLSLLLFLSLLANFVFIFFFIRRKNKHKIKAPDLSALTPKEKEVLELIIEKKSNKEIAASLFVSDATVKTHINNIYRKLNINSRKEVIELYNSANSTSV